MKKIFTLISFFIFFASAQIFAQSSVKFSETDYNFGDVTKNQPATHIFKFTNTSNQPLIIENALAGCGCTVPDYSKKPILPGQVGEIKVTYNAANPGSFTKDVQVKFANQADPVILKIRGTVVNPN